MNVHQILMPRAQAKEKLRAYRDRLKRGANAEYEAAAKGYEALERGKALLDLDEVFRDVLYDAKGRPRLAIARADRKQVCLEIVLREGAAFFRCGDSWRRNASPTLSVRVPYINDRVPATAPSEGYLRQGYALVPVVPADAIAGRMPDLSKRFILWEVEQWADSRITSRPDRDPYLLQHLAGTLYVIDAAWDLTDLERAITAGRRDRR